MNSRVTLSVISSQALEAGLTPVDSPDGRITCPSGPAPAPASRSRSRAKAAAPVIQGTYGPTSINSYAQDGPLLLWENRLRERLAMVGSMEFLLTWRKKVTPGGRSISRLAASTRPIFEVACIGWPSPNTPSGGPNFKKTATHTGGMDLEGAVAYLSAWQTPGVDSFRCRGGDRKDEMGLDQQAKYLAGWATPAERDHRFPNLKTFQERGGGKKGEQLPNQVAHFSGTTGSSSDPTPKVSIGALNPEFVSWLMGFPPEWLSSAPSVTPSSRKSRRK